MVCETPKDLHHRREKQRALIDAHHARFAACEREHRPCPVCGADKPREMFHKNGGRYVSCSDCMMIYLNPVLSDADLRAYYESNTTVQADSHMVESDFYRRMYADGLAQMGEPGSILDVGCSSGLFLDVAREQGWGTFGSELNADELRIASRKQHLVFAGLIDELPAPMRFDVIALWDVFEHLKDGGAFLDSARGRLNPGGRLFVQIPNGGSIAARILHEKCNLFDGIEHVNLYTVGSLKLLASRHGWQVESVHSVLDELQPVWNHLNYEHPYTGSFKFPVIFPFLSAEAILKYNFGYKLQAVLKPLEPAAVG
jgi:SAM-dependent methyltransferase